MYPSWVLPGDKALGTSLSSGKGITDGGLHNRAPGCPDRMSPRKRIFRGG